MRLFGPARSLALVVGLASCGSDVVNPPPGSDTTPAAISVVSGNTQSGTAGTALGNPLVVRVTNAAGTALSGVQIDWSIVTGGGNLSAITSNTNASGDAQITYTLGPSAGTNTVRATVHNTTISTDFSATASAAPVDMTPASIEIASGDAQSFPVGFRLTLPLSARVKNASGQLLSGIAVDWTVTQGGGTLSAASSNTNGSGVASVNYSLGPAAGANSVMAAVQSNAALNVPFGATATAATVTTAVNVMDSFFNPNAIQVAVSATVTWTWGGAIGHNITFVSGGTNKATQVNGTHTVTFNSAGVYQYYCTIHGSQTDGMRATVIVQ